MDLHRPLSVLLALATGASCVLAGLPACASARPHAPDPDVRPDLGELPLRARAEIPAGVAAAMDDARRLAALGRRGEAFARLEGALREAERSEAAAASRPLVVVDGERLLQDLLAGTRGDAWGKRRAEERHDRNPDSADAAYLRARIEASRGVQADLFDQALTIDAGHPYARLGQSIVLERSGDARAAVRASWHVAVTAPWFEGPWLHLASMSLSRGSPDAAERFLREAAVRAPDDVRPWIGIAAACDEMERPADAAHAAVEAIRRAPGDPAVLWPLARLLERCGDDGDRRDALAAVESARTEAFDRGAVEAFRGRMLVALGRFPEAEAALVEARRAGTGAGDVAVPLRRARAGAGRVAAAVEGWIADLPDGPLAAADERAPAWHELRGAAAEGEATAPAADRLVRALAAVGWLHEGSVVAARAAARWPDDPGLRSREAEIGSFRAFLDALGNHARNVRRAQRRGDDTTLDDTIAEVRRLSTALLGVDATEGLRLNHFALVGSFAATSDSTGAFRDLFQRWGLLLVVGARSGGGSEIMAGRLVSQRSGVRAEVLGTPVEYDEHWIETEGLPEGLAGRRSGIAGLTVGRFVLLQLDVVRSAPPPEDADLPFLPRAATHDAALRTLDTPSDVSRRIERALAAQGTLERDAFDAVVRHERVHVMDADRLLPPHRHPFAALAFAVGHGFSAAAMEQTLEARAAVGALVDSREPRAALAALLAFLPAEDGDTAHVAGYRRAIETAVDVILSDLAAFPTIDPRWNVVQQMDRLTSEQVRELGRRLLARMDA